MSSLDRLVCSKTAGNRRYLLVVRAGDESLHRNWISGSGQRNFDLLVSYYGSVRNRFREDGDIYHALPGTRWIAHHAIFSANPSLRDTYDYICFACDDLDADTATWNALFKFCDRHHFDLAQPAILGPISYAITAPVPKILYRVTTFVENMCPVFSRRALAVCGASFGESVSGWGLNHVWPRLIADYGGRLAIIDSICVTHTRGLREGSLYTLLNDLGVDPGAEKDSVMARNGIDRTDIRELSRVYRTVPHEVFYRLSKNLAAVLRGHMTPKSSGISTAEHGVRKRLREFIMLCQSPFWLTKAMRRSLLRSAGMTIDSSCLIEAGCFFSSGRMEIGPGTFINRDLKTDGFGPITIGLNVFVGPSVLIITGQHDILETPMKRASNVVDYLPTKICDGVWIGSRVIILPGVTIAAGCVIGAGSLVAGNTEPNGLYVGVPAKRKRDLPAEK